MVRTIGNMLAARLPVAHVGAGVRVHTSSGVARGRIIALDGHLATIAPFGALTGIAVGDRVETAPEALCSILGYGALGRAFDAVGTPLDGRGELRGMYRRIADDANVGVRLAVSTPSWTGVAAIDGLLTFGRGARIGVFGAPGTGKTTLLEAIARGVGADAVVIGLVGERGREAARWKTRVDARTTLVCATADAPAAQRVRAADVAMAQAAVLRDAGLDVLLILDSLARYATAMRELRVGLDEPVGRGGYPPSVLASLGRYLERAGATSNGCITVVATVLSDGGDEREPLSDAARAALDGHIVLSPEAARAGRFPAIDLLASTSRTMHEVVTEQQRADAASVRASIALLAETRDLRALGIGAVEDPVLARAVGAERAIDAFRYRMEPVQPHDAVAQLHEVASLLDVA